MANLEKTSKIKREMLSGEHYFQSLLEQACILQMLSEAQLEKIQLRCLALLAKKTERYNSGNSSIQIEKAQEILTSIFYTLGVWLKRYPCPDDAVALLQNEEIETLYDKGRAQINTTVKRVKLLHATLLPKLMETKNVFYRSTAAEGINGFFKLYDADFGAQEIHITADYPVYNQTEQLAGIEFIGRYVEQIYYENLFCIKFPPEAIHHLLCGFDEQYESLLFNLYEPVLAASLGCILIGADARRLSLTADCQMLLQRLFAEKPTEKIVQILKPALSQLCSSFSLGPGLQDYIEQSLPLLAVKIKKAAETKRLAQVFIVPSYPENHPKLIVSFGERMDNQLYRKILAEFMGCRLIRDKTAVMNEWVLSLADLNDFLLDAELSADEITILLNERAPAEVAALIKKYRATEEAYSEELRDPERVLCEALRKFVSSLPADQQAWFNRAVPFLEVN